MAELLRCPFCGSEPYMSSSTDEDGCYWSKVKCHCGVSTRGKWASSSANTCPQFYAEVRDEWNQRTPSHSVPADMALVPLEPSVVMMNAGVDADDLQTGFERLRVMYKAMLSAASDHQQNAAQGGGEK